jgi:hypothetical protein
MAAAQEPDDLVPSDIRAEIPHPARVYDFWLGGKDNFAADRAIAEQVLAVMPEILDTVRGNRRFLARAVAFLRESGIRQFLDLGSGLPSSPNVHEIAQQGGTEAQVVYVDHDRRKSGCVHGKRLSSATRHAASPSSAIGVLARIRIPHFG